MKSVSDVDLDNPAVIKELLKSWESIETLSEDLKYTKINDLKIELEQRWSAADMTDQQRAAVRLNLVDRMIQDEVARELGFKSGRWISRLVEQGLEKIAEARWTVRANERD